MGRTGVIVVSGQGSYCGDSGEGMGCIVVAERSVIIVVVMVVVVVFRRWGRTSVIVVRKWSYSRDSEQLAKVSC